MQRILAVEDNRDILYDIIQRELEKRGYEVHCAEDAESALQLLDDGCVPDLVILDIVLPGMSGLDLFEELKGQFPVIFLTGLDGEADIVGGLEGGAADYITKPFLPGVLLARVRKVLRNQQAAPTNPDVKSDGVLTYGDLVFDTNRRQVVFDGKSIELTPRQRAVLEVLMRRPGWAYTLDQIADLAWPGVHVSPLTVKSHLTRARKSIEEVAGRDAIESAGEQSYRMCDWLAPID